MYDKNKCRVNIYSYYEYVLIGWARLSKEQISHRYRRYRSGQIR